MSLQDNAAPAATEGFTPPEGMVDLDAPEASTEIKGEQPPAAPQESSPEDAAPATEQPSDEAKEPDPAEVPPIEAPRSWTKEDKEWFAGLPRETAERIAERERLREQDFSRRQNEAVEKTKELTSKEQAAEQARNQYETALPILLQNLHTAMAGDFADIKNMADVQKMAAEDWPRYIRWDAQQKQIAGVQQEIQASQYRQTQERVQKFTEYATEQDRKFIETVPEMADPAKRDALQDAALSALQDLGYSERELAEWWNNSELFRDHRMQRLIAKAVQWDQAQAKAKAAVPKSQPKPLSPGVAAARSAPSDLATAADKGDMAAYVAMRKKGAIR